MPCGGWLAPVGSAHPGVRMAVMSGTLPHTVLHAAEDSPALHESYGEVLAKLRASFSRKS